MHQMTMSAGTERLSGRKYIPAEMLLHRILQDFRCISKEPVAGCFSVQTAHTCRLVVAYATVYLSGRDWIVIPMELFLANRYGSEPSRVVDYGTSRDKGVVS